MNNESSHKRGLGPTVRSARRTFFACAIVALGASLLSHSALAGGRPADTSRNWFGQFNGGYVIPDGNTMDDGWSIGGGAMFWPEQWKVGLVFDASYTTFDFSNETINYINDEIDLIPDNDGHVDGGDLEIWGFDVNAVWGPGKKANGLYLTAGIGIKNVEAKLFHEGLVYYPPICDPWYWWWCIPGGIGTGDIIDVKKSSTEFGYNVGVGWNFETPNGQIYVEASYDVIEMDAGDIKYMPITMGIRF